MRLGIIRLYCGESGKKGFYNLQEVGLAKSLIKYGIKVDIFFLDNKIKNKFSIEEINKDIRIITLRANKLLNHGIIHPNFLKKFNVDIVHLLSDNQMCSPKIIKFCKKNKITCYCYIGTITSDSTNVVKNKLTNLLIKRNIKYYKKVSCICKTTEVENELKRRGVVNTRVIPVGLDLAIVPNIKESVQEIRAELKLNGYKTLLFVGRLEEYKKPLKFIELIKYINENSTEFKAIIIGDGKLKGLIQEKIKEYSLQNMVVLIEKIENTKIHKYYKGCDVFINMNDNEIFGMSILESMYQGCPIVAHNAPGPNYIIENNKSGVLINSYDDEKWFSAIIHVVNDREMKTNCKNRIVNELNWNSLSKQFLEVIQSVGEM